MQCTEEEIERKRRIAQERLAKRKLDSPVKHVFENTAPFPKQIKLQDHLNTPNLELKSQPDSSNIYQSTPTSANNTWTNNWQKDNVRQEATATATTSTSYNTGKVVTCNCSLISASRFSVDMVGFSTAAVDIFKSIPSRKYDVHKKTWNFDVKDYVLFISRLTPLNPAVVVGILPKFILKLCQQHEYEPMIDLSNIDEEIRTSLYPYQEDGVCFGIRKKGRCLLADDMGLGKTIQALAIAHYYKNDWPLLIATTASMRNVWEESIHKFLPSVPLMKIQYLSSSKDTIENCLVIIISHDLLGKCIDRLLSPQQRNGAKKFGVFIVDESHTFKNFQTKGTQKALLMAKASKRVILLSGTPALSKPCELFTQLQLIDEKFFGNFKAYSKRYCDGHQTQFGWNATGHSNLTELEVVLAKKFMIRRTKESILKSLPNKIQEVVMLDVNLDGFLESERKNLSDLAKKYQNTNSKRERHSVLLTFFSETAKIKIPSVCSFIIETLDTSNKFLVFAHHHVMLDAIASVLMKCRKEYIRIDGHVNGEHRKPLIDRYQTDSNCVCALLSTTAANAGITLTAGHLVIFAELHWNPSILSQAESRAHRIGQSNQVIVKYLLARGTADDFIWPMLQTKQKTLQEIGLCKETLKETTVQEQRSTSNSDCLNSSITSKNTLDISTYFTQLNPRKEEGQLKSAEEKRKSINEEEFFDDNDFDDILNNVNFDDFL